MKARIMKPTIALTLAVSLSLAGCAGSGADYVPVSDGPRDVGFASDLADCRDVAKQRSYINADTKTDTLIGALIGGLVGLTGDQALGGAVVGTTIGAAAGAGGGALKVRQERKHIVVECMRQRGHSVVG